MLETLDPGFLLTPAGRLAAVAVAAALAAAALLALGPRRRAAPAVIATGLRLQLHTADLGLDRSPGAAHVGVWGGRPLAPPLRHHRKLVAVGGRPGQAQARGVVTAFATPAPAVGSVDQVGETPAKRARPERIRGCDLGKMPFHTTSWDAKKQQWGRGQKRSQQRRCDWPRCKADIRTYCECNPGRPLCARHVVKHAINVASGSTDPN